MNTADSATPIEILPSLPLAEWVNTCETLHMWMQVVGKIKLELTPRTNHWWNVAFYTTARGLTTSTIPFSSGVIQIDFDFLSHALRARTSLDTGFDLKLEAMPVTDFYRKLMAELRKIGITAHIWTMPVEVPNPIPFDKDTIHQSYDPEYANRFWRILLWADTVMKEFRARFIGKDSPVHFFWGSFDLAVTRFSGRLAPPREGADSITAEAYSHEVTSVGFWPGTGVLDGPAFYSYAAPEPLGFAKARVKPAAAFYSSQLKEYLLPYEEIRKSRVPRQDVLDFFQSTYDAAAKAAGWNRTELERAA